VFQLERFSLKDKVSQQEWQTRLDLAACYRLVAVHGWGDLIYTHLSARVPDTEHYLVNAFGLTFEEVSASNLVKVDLQGNVLDGSPYTINPAGFTIHSAIHEVRHDANCVIHLHTKAQLLWRQYKVAYNLGVNMRCFHYLHLVTMVTQG
jgi:ribulose-5-phosphate 4-epimerase/fuculose-1-phosphate aldolase